MIEFIRREIRWIGAGFLLTFFSGFGQTYFISLSNDAVRARFDLSNGEIGTIYALATLTSAVVLLQFGKIVDRVSTRLAALITVGGLAVACLLLSWALAVWMLFLAYLGLRLFGQGMMSHVAMTATGRWFEANRGRAVSLVALGHPVSEAVMPPLAVALLLALGLQGLWTLAAAALAAMAAPLLVWLLVRERAPQAIGPADTAPTAARKASWRRAQVLGEPAFWLLLLGVLCPPFMVTGLFFHQLHLIEMKAWLPATFAAGFTAFAATQMVSSLTAGWMVDRFSARALLPAYLLPLALALCLPALFNGAWAIFVMMMLIGLTGGAAATVMGAIWPELFGPQHLGEIRALTFAAMVAATSVSPILTGLLIDRGVAFTSQLVGMGGYALLASALMGLIQPRLARIAGDRLAPAPA